MSYDKRENVKGVIQECDENKRESGVVGAMEAIECSLLYLSESATRLCERIEPVLVVSDGSKVVDAEQENKMNKVVLQQSPLTASLLDKSIEISFIANKLSGAADRLDI